MVLWVDRSEEERAPMWNSEQYLKYSLHFWRLGLKYRALIPLPWVKANLERSRHILLSKFASARHMSEMISEAETPATSFDIKGQIKENVTKAEIVNPPMMMWVIWHTCYSCQFSVLLLLTLPAVRRVSLELAAWFWSEENNHNIVGKIRMPSPAFQVLNWAHWKKADIIQLTPFSDEANTPDCHKLGRFSLLH